MGTEINTDEETAEYRQNVEEHNREMAQTEKSQLKYQKRKHSIMSTIN